MEKDSLSKGWGFTIVLSCFTFLVGFLFFGNHNDGSDLSASDMNILLPAIKWMYPTVVTLFVAWFLNKFYSDIKLFRIFKRVLIVASSIFFILALYEVIGVISELYLGLELTNDKKLS